VWFFLLYCIYLFGLHCLFSVITLVFDFATAKLFCCAIQPSSFHCILVFAIRHYTSAWASLGIACSRCDQSDCVSPRCWGFSNCYRTCGRIPFVSGPIYLGYSWVYQHTSVAVGVFLVLGCFALYGHCLFLHWLYYKKNAIICSPNTWL